MFYLWVLFFVIFPAFILYLCRRFPFLEKIGAAGLCYLAGLAIGNMGILTPEVKGVQTAFLTYTVPVALPLLFFSLDIRKWSRVAGKSFLSFGCALVAALISATTAFLLFGPRVGEESWKVAGMLIGCYTGGSPNLAAIGTALGVEPSLYVAVNVADVIVPPVYLLLAITVLQRIMLSFLRPFDYTLVDESGTGDAAGDFTRYDGIFDRDRVLPLLAAFGLALVIFGAGGGLSMAVPKEYSGVATILSIATMGVAVSFFPPVRNIKMTFQFGQYIILIFCVAVSSLADMKTMLSSAPVMMGFVAISVFLAAAIHAVLAWVFRIAADTMIITSIAARF